MLKPIKTEREYQTVLARVYELMQGDVKEDSAASNELEVLSILVNAYEQVHYPISLPT
jgi:HTH-type transcriptional regulator/antitoxin HigA